MNRKLLCWMIVAAWAGTAPVRAQDSASKPTAPFFVVPGEGTWTMTVSASGNSASAATPAAPVSKDPIAKTPQLRERRTEQKNKIRHETDVWSNGTTTDTWILKGKRVTLSPVSHRAHLIDPRRMALMAADATRDDVLSVTWLSGNTFVRTENYKGRPCYLFERHAAPLPSPTPDPNSDAYELMVLANRPGKAWVDVDNKQMAAYNDGSKLFAFTYGPPPTEELIPPVEVTQLLQRYEDALNPLKIAVPPAR